MKKIITILVILSFNFSFSQTNTSEKEIKNTVNLFFAGLQNGDSTTVGKTIHKNFRGQTTRENSSGVNVLTTVSREEFINIINSKNPNDSWLEKIGSFTIEIDNNLANVWTPCVFYFNNQLSHCGSNSIQLIFQNNKWQIVSIIDTRRTENCN